MMGGFYIQYLEGKIAFLLADHLIWHALCLLHKPYGCKESWASFFYVSPNLVGIPPNQFGGNTGVCPTVKSRHYVGWRSDSLDGGCGCHDQVPMF
jgi:hypothetical protein